MPTSSACSFTPQPLLVCILLPATRPCLRPHHPTSPSASPPNYLPAAGRQPERVVVLKVASSRLLAQAEQFANELTRYLDVCAPDCRIVRQVRPLASQLIGYWSGLCRAVVLADPHIHVVPRRVRTRLLHRAPGGPEPPPASQLAEYRSSLCRVLVLAEADTHTCIYMCCLPHLPLMTSLS
jgi:hypothetical protein